MEGPLRLHSLNHVSRVVRDVRACSAFYRDVLGFIEIRRPEAFTFEGAWLYDERTHLGIHLIGGIPEPRSSDINPASDHLSFLSDSMEDAEAMLIRAGVKYVKRTVLEAGFVVSQIFFHDPENHMIELCNCDEIPIVPLKAGAVRDLCPTCHPAVTAPPVQPDEACAVQGGALELDLEGGDQGPLDVTPGMRPATPPRPAPSAAGAAADAPGVSAEPCSRGPTHTDGACALHSTVHPSRESMDASSASASLSCSCCSSSSGSSATDECCAEEEEEEPVGLLGGEGEGAPVSPGGDAMAPRLPPSLHNPQRASAGGALSRCLSSSHIPTVARLGPASTGQALIPASPHMPALVMAPGGMLCVKAPLRRACSTVAFASDERGHWACSTSSGGAGF